MRPVLAVIALFAAFSAGPANGQLAEPNGAGVTRGHIHMNVSEVVVRGRVVGHVVFDVEYRELDGGLGLAFFTNSSGTRWEWRRCLRRSSGGATP